MSPPRIYLKDQAATEPPHFSCSQFAEKMFFKGRTWLWLYITTGFVLGSEIHGSEQRGGNNCFQLSSFRCSFEGAEQHCHALGGHLAFTWNQEVQDLLWNFLEKEKWWVGGNLTLPEKHQGKNHPGEALRFSVHEGNFLTFPLRWEKERNVTSFVYREISHFVTIVLKCLHVCAPAFHLSVSGNDEIFLSQGLSKVNLLAIWLKVLCKILKWLLFFLVKKENLSFSAPCFLTQKLGEKLFASCLSYTDIFKLRHSNLRVLKKSSRHYYIIGTFLVAEMVRNLPAMQETRFDPWVRKIPWRKEWQPTPVFLPGESHGQMSLVGYSPLGRKESDTFVDV